MPKPKRYERIAITLPPKDLAAADRLASTHDRSRSWIVAEAIRQYAARQESAVSPATNEPRESSNEDITVAGAVRRPGLGAQRLAQLTRDLTLTPEERVRAAEETLTLSTSVHGARSRYLVAFDRYQEYLDWKRRQDAGG